MRESWQSFFGKERAIRHLLRGQPDAAGVAFRVNSALARKPRPADSARRLLRVIKTRMAAGELPDVTQLPAPTRTLTALRTTIAAEGGRHTMSQVTALRALASANAAQSVLVNNAAADARRRIRELRAAEGRRHSQADLDNLMSAHAALVEAGASCGDNATAQSQGASPEHQARLDFAHDAIAATAPEVCDNPVTPAARVTDPNAGADNLPNTRKPVASRYSQAPDPYEKALVRRAAIRAAQTPDADPNYAPRGAAPDSYGLALALKTALASASDVEPSPMVRDSAGTPDGYATALRKVTHGNN